MKEVTYRNFSWHTHKKNWQLRKPNICKFELTFGCALRCKHCYSDCYNKPAYLRRELKTIQVKSILDEIYKAGVIWLCLTGGDPLIRKDFRDIYSYAKNRGFIVTIFTNAYSITRKIAGYLKKQPPFVIEITLNAVTKETYEKISQVQGSFKKVMRGISLIMEAKLPLKIKTQITKDNLRELPKIRKFIAELGLDFNPSYDLFARLNGDFSVCDLRISPEEILSLDGNIRTQEDDCRFALTTKDPLLRDSQRKSYNGLFRCAVGGGDGFQVDPYGNAFLCNLIREPAFNLLKVSLDYTLNNLLSLVKNKKFITDSKCNGCNLRGGCRWCPGKAYVEKGNKETPIDYYCRLAELIHQH